MDYLTKLAKVLHAQDEEKAVEQKEQWKQILKEEGGTTMISVLENFNWPEQLPGLKDMRNEVLTYFRNQEHRMDYPTYQANGWYIGSGAVESACKTVVNQRLKGAGMRWGETGSHEVCHVRALYRSERSQWQAFWRRHVNRSTTKRPLIQHEAVTTQARKDYLPKLVGVDSLFSFQR